MKLPAVLRYLAILIAAPSSEAWADDCKPIVEALAKQANTSFRVLYHGTEWDKNVYAGRTQAFPDTTQMNSLTFPTRKLRRSLGSRRVEP